MLMLPHDFKVIRENDNEAYALFTLTEDLGWFQGHFPEYALLPGVAQIYFLNKILQEVFGSALWIKGFSDLKFMRPMLPLSSGRLKLTRKEAGKFSFVLYDITEDSEILCAKGNFKT